MMMTMIMMRMIMMIGGGGVRVYSIIIVISHFRQVAL